MTEESAVKSPQARLMTATFTIRDDEAACNDCDWAWKQPASGAYSVTGGGKAAREHAKSKVHETVVRRVQFVRHTGLDR